MNRTGKFFIINAFDNNCAVGGIDMHLGVGMVLKIQLALGAFKRNNAAIDGDFDVLREGDGLFTDTAHVRFLFLPSSDIRYQRAFRFYAPVRRPRRNISLVDRGEQFAADVLLTRLAITQHAPAGGEHHYAKTLNDAGEILHRAIHTATRLADALELAEHLLARRRVLDRHPDQALFRAVIKNREVRDVSFILQDLGDALADLGVLDVHSLVLGGRGVTEAGQHIGDCITHIYCPES